jgi:hypothetical protein
VLYHATSFDQMHDVTFLHRSDFNYVSCLRTRVLTGDPRRPGTANRPNLVASSSKPSESAALGNDNYRC